MQDYSFQTPSDKPSVCHLPLGETRDCAKNNLIPSIEREGKIPPDNRRIFRRLKKVYSNYPRSGTVGSTEKENDMTNDNTYRALSQDEVAARISNGKQNRLSATPGRSVGQIVRANLLTFFNFLNLAIALVLILVGSYRNTLFMGVVICNAIIGLVQELRAKHTVDRLSILSAGKLTVYRYDPFTKTENTVILPAQELVEDDKLYLHAGDEIPADGVVLSGFVEVNESLLTGESKPVQKRAGDSLLSGSFVVSGSCDARLTAVGDESFAAKLTAEAKQLKPAKSRLMADIRLIIRIVGGAVVPIGLILFAKSYFWLGNTFTESVVSAAASMIGMIPEGLVLLTSIALAVGIIRLGQQNVLAQEMYCTENLARVDVLCLDKTGTITSGELTMSEVIPLGIEIGALRQLLSDYLTAVPDSNATYRALCSYFDEPVQQRAEEVTPFSSERKYSSAVFAGKVYRLGAPELLLSGEDERVISYQKQGNRVIAFVSENEPLALLVLTDRLRENAAEVCGYFKEQGVILKVISGDSPYTASAAARKAGIAGAERLLDCRGLSNDALAEAAEKYTIFGRVTPEQKKLLVTRLQENGHTVAMTGDGVNDILAMKQADCSISFGAGADAARKAAQIVLLDSQFSALPQVLLQGRRVIGNITRSASLFLVKTCFSALLSLILVFVPFAYPFAPINLTLISSLMIGIPSFLLALEPNFSRVKGRFLWTVAKNALPGGMTVSIILLALMISGKMLHYEPELMRTAATYATALVAFWNLIMTCRPFRKRHLFLILAVAVVFTGAVLGLPEVFMLLPFGELIKGAGWLMLLALLLSIPVYEGIRRLVGWLLDRRTAQ